MEIIPQSILELGQAVTTAFIIYLIIKEILSSKKKNSGITSEDKSQDVCIARIDERLKTIEMNHLPHIQKAMEQNATDHEEMKVGLAEIDIKLEELLTRRK